MGRPSVLEVRWWDGGALVVFVLWLGLTVGMVVISRWTMDERWPRREILRQRFSMCEK